MIAWGRVVATSTPGVCVFVVILLSGAVDGQLAWAQAAPNPDALFRKLDANGDGVLTMDEATVGTRSLMDRTFKAAGKSAAASLSRDEFREAYEQSHAKSGAPSSTKPPSSASSGSATSAASEPLDADGDGVISKAEWTKFIQKYSQLDSDKDGFVDASELGVAGAAADALMKLGDTNGDGKIARLEWARLIKSFNKLDANQDGKLDQSELQKSAEEAVAAASGSASLSSSSGKSAKNTGPTLWRGRIEGRSQIELLVTGERIDGREIGGGENGRSLGAGTFTMTGDGKTGYMDAVYTEGDRAGQTCLGIYKMDGNTLVWCVNNRGSRPQEFASGQGNWLLTLTKVEDPTATKTR